MDSIRDLPFLPSDGIKLSGSDPHTQIKPCLMGSPARAAVGVSMVQYPPSPIASLTGCGVMAPSVLFADFASRSSVSSTNFASSKQGDLQALLTAPARIVPGWHGIVKRLGAGGAETGLLDRYGRIICSLGGLSLCRACGSRLEAVS